jgi:simple sugar transport system ATP-binding protein
MSALSPKSTNSSTASPTKGLRLWVISLYLPEILHLSNRILVSRQGRVSEEFAGTEATEEPIMYAAGH